MRKAKKKYPVPIGYALFVNDGKMGSKSKLLKKDKQYKKVLNELKMKVCSYVVLDETKVIYTIVQYSDEQKFQSNHYYDKKVLTLNPCVAYKAREVQEQYIDCLEYMFEDRHLVEQLESIIENCCASSNKTNEYKQMLDVGDLKELFESVKRADFDRYLLQYRCIENKFRKKG
jgi:hypothetical protein